MIISKNLKKRIITSLLLIVLTFLIFSFKTILLFSLISLGIFSFIEFSQILNRIHKGKFSLIFFNIIFILYIFIFCLIFFYFSIYIHLKIILLTILLGCIASDVGGFIFGKIFKGPKLTKISPNKTISGAIGSLIFCSITMIGLYFYFIGIFNLEILIVSLITSISSQIGDLFFSYLKRKAKIKDTGNILPGHGGVLDRVDGIFFGIPAGFISLVLFY